MGLQSLSKENQSGNCLSHHVCSKKNRERDHWTFVGQFSWLRGGER